MQKLHFLTSKFEPFIIQPHHLFHLKKQGLNMDGEVGRIQIHMLWSAKSGDLVVSAGKFCCSMATHHHMGCPGNTKDVVTTSTRLTVISIVYIINVVLSGLGW